MPSVFDLLRLHSDAITFLLLEDDFFLLLEDGSKLILG